MSQRSSSNLDERACAVNVLSCNSERNAESVCDRTDEEGGGCHGDDDGVVAACLANSAVSGDLIASEKCLYLLLLPPTLRS
jgi:hypothetical protein